MLIAIDVQDSLIVRPTTEPLDLDEVKKQRRFSPTSLDTLFDLWISASRGHFEEQTGRQLMTATWEYWMQDFPVSGRIELPHPPLLTVVSVKYDDGAGTEQTLDPASYRVVAPAGDYCRRGVLELNSGSAWPSTLCQSAAVRIRYTAGYGAAPGAVPELFRHALLMLVGHFHKFGEEVNEARATLPQQLPLGGQMVIEAAKYAALPQLPPPTRSALWTEPAWRM